MLRLVTLTRDSSLKRPIQLMTIGKDILSEMESLAERLRAIGYTVVWNDNPKAILTKVTKNGLSSYCCVAYELEPTHIEKLSSAGIEIIKCNNCNILIIDESDQMVALNRLYSCTGRISVI